MGAPDGFQELLEDQTPALFRRALLLCGDWHFAEDLVQETAMTALMKWRKVRKANNPAGYLQTMLTNKYLSYTRTRSSGEIPSEIKVPETVDPWPNIDLELQVAQSLSVLTPQERSVIVARYLDDQTFGEIAKQTGRKEASVRVLAHRAVAKMRDHAETQLSQPASSSGGEHYEPKRSNKIG